MLKSTAVMAAPAPHRLERAENIRAMQEPIPMGFAFCLQYSSRGDASCAVWDHQYWDARLGHCNECRCVTVESCPARAEVAS